MTDVVVCTTFGHAASVRRLLAGACAALGLEASLDLFNSGSLYQRLGARRSPPFPDLVLWSGPYAAHAAAGAGLLQRHQPPDVPALARHHPEWFWTAVEFQPFRVAGEPPASTLEQLSMVPRLALSDPERSEVGAMLLLATLDRARQIDGDPESAWLWWTRRVQTGVRTVEEDAFATDSVRQGRATHAVTLRNEGSLLLGLAPVPHAMSVAANAPNVDAARRLFDWLAQRDAQPGAGLSAWQSEVNGLGEIVAAAPPLDVEWATQQYTPARRRWAQSGFGPRLETA